MTRAKKTLIVIVSVIVALIAVINLILFNGLTSIIKKRLPEVTKASGINVDFSRLSVSLPSGTVRLSDLIVNKHADTGTNTAHLLSMGKASINIGLLSLPRGVIKLSSIDIKDTRLTLAGSNQGLSLMTPGGRSTGPQQGDTTPESTETGKTNRPPEDTGYSTPAHTTLQTVPKAIIGTARINTVVEYINPTNNVKLALDLKIRADNLRTFGNQEKDLGSFSVKGNLEGKPNSMMIDIKGSTTPFSIPGKPSFEVNGAITNICTRDFKELADSMGIEADCIDFNIRIKCDKGVFTWGACNIGTKITNKAKITMIMMMRCFA